MAYAICKYPMQFWQSDLVYLPVLAVRRQASLKAGIWNGVFKSSVPSRWVEHLKADVLMEPSSAHQDHANVRRILKVALSGAIFRGFSWDQLWSVGITQINRPVTDGLYHP